MSDSYGTIYLLQPREYIETNVYKIGLSHKNDLKRCLSYGKDTKFISIHECKNPRVIENIIKDEFNNKFEKCRGQEYFKGNISEIYKLFNRLVIDYNNKDDCYVANNEAYEADESVDICNNNLKQTKTEYNKKKTKYYCNLCNFKTKIKENLRVHNTTKKHKKKVYESKDYKCDLCFYSTSFYQNYQKHLETQKHKSKMIEEKEQEIVSDNEKEKTETIKMLVNEIKGNYEEIKRKDENIKEIMYKMYEDQKQIYEDQKKMYEKQIEDIKKTLLMPNHTNI